MHASTHTTTQPAHNNDVAQRAQVLFNWDPDDEIAEAHRLFSPTCPLVTGEPMPVPMTVQLARKMHASPAILSMFWQPVNGSDGDSRPGDISSVVRSNSVNNLEASDPTSLSFVLSLISLLPPLCLSLLSGMGRSRNQKSRHGKSPYSHKMPGQQLIVVLLAGGTFRNSSIACGKGPQPPRWLKGGKQ